METVSKSTSRRLFYKLPLGSAACFSGITEMSNKRAKGWWNNNIKAARKVMKETMRRYKIR